METLVLIAVVLFVVVPVLFGVALRMLLWGLYGYVGAKALRRLTARRERSDGHDG